MEQSINSFNVEVGAFVRNLRSYTNRKDNYISNNTIALFSDAVACIDKLVAAGKLIDIKNEANSIDFLNDLDERYYELRQNIVCKLCIEPITISKDDFEAHVQKVSHVFQARNIQTPPSRQLYDSQLSKPVNDSWKRDSCRSNIAHDGSNRDKSSVKSFEDVLIHSTATEHSVHNKIQSYEFVSEMTDRSKGHSEERIKQHPERLQAKVEVKQTKEDSLENVVDTAWKGVRVFESSHSESSDSSSHGFNYDSVYLVELQNLPRSATRKEIKDFFPGISILNGLYGIHFILDEKYRKYGRAFVQLEHLREYQSIKKFNQNHLDGRCIDVSVGNNSKFKEMVTQRKIPPKDRVVFVEGLPLKYNEQDIRLFFEGLHISRVHLVLSDLGSFSDCAYVKFSFTDDVEKAVKLNNKKSRIHIYRSTEEEMRSSYQGGLKRSSLQSFSNQDNQSSKSPNDDDSKSRNDSRSYSGDIKFVRVRGIPWEANEDYVFDLFPGLEIDRKNGIQMERDRKGRNNGTAFVEIKNAADYDVALKADLKETNRHLKVTKATKAEFFLTKDDNIPKNIR